MRDRPPTPSCVPSAPPSRTSWFALDNLPYLILGVLAAISVLSRLYLALR
jgi:hypothetical protein